MAQWTVIRMAMVEHRDLAQMMSAGLRGELAELEARVARMQVAQGEFGQKPAYGQDPASSRQPAAE